VFEFFRSRIPLWNIPLTADHGFELASAKVWGLYESEADKYDTELAETWKGQTDAMLIFVRTPCCTNQDSRYKSR
jgi:hypothetical protein